ncbi:MAG: HAD family phosphatase, partial [Sphingomonas sp.]
ERLGVSASDCLVFEDAPAGITAGEAAGADVLVITATHGTTHRLDTLHPRIDDYLGVTATITSDGRLAVTSR